MLLSDDYFLERSSEIRVYLFLLRRELLQDSLLSPICLFLRSGKSNLELSKLSLKTFVLSL